MSVPDLAAIYLLESIKGFGPQKFKDLHEARIPPADVLARPDRLPYRGKRGESFRNSLSSFTVEKRFETEQQAIRQLLAASKHNAFLLTYDHPAYPASVYASNNPVPVLYARGAIDVLNSRAAVACVGSRKIREPYSTALSRFATTAAEMGAVVVSGFALGADRLSHEAAYRAQGQTICVMPGGLERPFPPESRDLWDSLLDYPKAAFVSEFRFGMRAAALTLRKRNKLTVSFAGGVFIGQSSSKGGAMNAYRFALEQRKPVATLEPDGHDDSTGNADIAQKSSLHDVVFPLNASPDDFNRWLQLSCFST